MERTTEKWLNFHGVSVRVESVQQALLDELAQDFAYFQGKPLPKADFTVVVVVGGTEMPDWRGISWAGSRSRVYWGTPRRVCFFGSQWVEYNYWQGEARVTSFDPNSLFEVLMLLILSYVGERLDEQGWHRLHGLGYSIGRQVGVVMAPSGGGKSSLLLHLMVHAPRLRLFSDDTPLIGQKGVIRSFAQRISIREVPTEYSKSSFRVFHRVGHGKKYVLSARVFGKWVNEQDAIVDHLVVLDRRAAAGLRPLGKLRGSWALLRWMVLGLETPQIWELRLRFQWRDVYSLVKALLHRSSVAWGLVRRVPVYQLGGGSLTDWTDALRAIELKTKNQSSKRSGIMGPPIVKPL